MEWPGIVERIRREHNGVFSVELFFGHDGNNVCSFHDYERERARGESGESMQEAVDRCLRDWNERAAKSRINHQAEVDRTLLRHERMMS